jgi:phage terminase large subunit-like protein
MLGALPREMVERRVLANLELARRRKDDPLFGFDPFPVQKKFIEAVIYGEPLENYYIGANRSGKSDAGAAAGSILARFGDQSDAVPWVRGRGSSIEVRDRATSGWVSALDFPTSRDTIQPKYFDNGFVAPGVSHPPFIPAREIENWRVSDQVLILKNGSIVGFKSADSGRLKYQGAEKDWIHFDEEHPKSVYEEATIRIGAKPLKLFTTCTLLPPEGTIGGITWVYNDIVKPWKSGVLEGISLFNASIYDNPHLPSSEIVRLEARYPEDSVQRRIRLNGELIPGLSGSRVYVGFQAGLNVRRQPDIALRRPLCWIWDFNVEPMVTLLGQRDRTLFRVFRELYLDEGNIQEMCDLFRQAHPLHLAEVWIYGDASGKDRSHQTRRSSYWLISNYMRDYPAPVKMKILESNPLVPDRINAMNVACKNEEGVINLEIDPTCKELADDLEQVVSDGKGGIKKTTNKREPYFKRTHASDALGYWVSYEAPVATIRLGARGALRRGVARPRYSGIA